MDKRERSECASFLQSKCLSWHATLKSPDKLDFISLFLSLKRLAQTYDECILMDFVDIRSERPKPKMDACRSLCYFHFDSIE